MSESFEERYTEYLQMSDDDVAMLAQQGDGDALEYLLDKYKNFVRARARSYFLVGADHEDIVQEGMIGLYKSIRDYKPDKQSLSSSLESYDKPRQCIKKKKKT